MEILRSNEATEPVVSVDTSKGTITVVIAMEPEGARTQSGKGLLLASTHGIVRSRQAIRVNGQIRPIRVSLNVMA